MIPPVEVRQIRLCESCHCYWEAPCPHDGVGCSINGPRTEPSDHDWDKTYYFKQNGDEIPCISHLTPEEYHELIDSVVV
jgi:hypothetical protein